MEQENKNLEKEEEIKIKAPKIGLLRHLRGYFLAGILITAPIGITFYLAWLFINWIDDKITPLLPEAYNPETYLPFGIPGLGLLILCIAMTFVGAITAGILGRI